jgi:hypothetical protein
LRGGWGGWTCISIFLRSFHSILKSNRDRVLPSKLRSFPGPAVISAHCCSASTLSLALPNTITAMKDVRHAAVALLLYCEASKPHLAAVPRVGFHCAACVPSVAALEADWVDHLLSARGHLWYDATLSTPRKLSVLVLSSCVHCVFPE